MTETEPPPKNASGNPYEAPRTTRFTPERDRNRLRASFVVDSKLIYRAYSIYAWQSTLMRFVIFPVTSLALVALLLMLLSDAPRSYLLACALTFCVLHIVQMAVPHLQVKWLIRDVRKRVQLQWSGPQQLEVDGQTLTIHQSGRTLHKPLAELHDVQFVGDILLLSFEPGVVLPIPSQGDFGPDTFLSFCEEFAKRVHAAREGAENEGPEAPGNPG